MANQIDKKLLPFKLISSSLNTGYLEQISANGLPNIEFVNMHRDIYGDSFTENLQSPFTKQHVGGEQHRHVALNTGNDNDFNRPEFYKIQISSSAIRVFGPEYENVNKPRVPYWRGATSPMNIANIQTSGTIIGNYQRSYEVVQTSGRGLSNNLIAGGYTASITLTPTQFIRDANNFTLPNLITSNKSVIVERFNAPGGKNESSRGVLDRGGEEYSANNSLLSRNISVRQPFYDRLTQHSPQFGSGSTFATLPSTGISDAVSIHKVNRNGLRRLKLSGSTIINSSLYDNFWVQHAIPQDNFGYAWITASAISNPYTIGSSQILFDITSSLSTIKDKDINLDTQTIFGSLKNLEQYYSTWRQIRTAEHPVARKLRENNYISIEEARKPVQRKDGVVIIPTRTGNSVNYKEPPVTNKYFPIKQNIQFKSQRDGTFTSLNYSYKNSMFKFANESIDQRLNLIRKNPEFYDQLVKTKNSKTSTIKNIISLTFKENVYPRALNTYLSGTRSRTQYITDRPGFDRDGYDRQLGTQRVFWRDNQENRRRSSNSSGGYINSLGYSSLEESGSDFIQNDNGVLIDNSFINLSASFIQNFINLDKGINNSIIPLEYSTSERELFIYTGSFEKQFYNNKSLSYKIASNIVKRAYTGDISGELNSSFVDFYEQFLKNDKKQSIGAIYKNSSFKSILNNLSINRQDLIDVVSQTEDESIIFNPKPRYVSFIGGGELNVGSEFDNSSNFNNDYQNTYISGANSSTVKIIKDEVNQKFYIGGNFSTIGGVSSTGIVEYDIKTQKFIPISGIGVAGSVSVQALLISGSDLYVGGLFTSPVPYLAKWNIPTRTWSQVIPGITLGNTVRALALSGSDLYIGGSFLSSALNPITGIGKYNILRRTWSSISGSGTNIGAPVRDILVTGSDIYIAGQFNITNPPGQSIVRYSVANNTFESLVTGSFPNFYKLLISGSDLYAAGSFTNINGTSSINNIAKFSLVSNPSKFWYPLSGGLNAYSTSLLCTGSSLYVGGFFTVTGTRLAIWDTVQNNWSAVSSTSGLDFEINDLLLDKNRIHIMGNFFRTPYGTRRMGTLSIESGSSNFTLFNTGFEYSKFNKNILSYNLSSSDIIFSTLDNGLINNKIKYSSYDNIENYYKTDLYQIAKDSSILPEFKISDHLNYFITSKNSDFKSKNNSFLILDGIGANYKSSTTETSSIDRDFLNKYCFTDILNKNQIENDYSKELNQDKISINIKSIKKLLPYNGFYPQDRTIQIGNLYKKYTDDVLDGGTFSLNNVNDFSNNVILTGSTYAQEVSIGINKDFKYFEIVSNLNIGKYSDKYYLSVEEFTDFYNSFDGNVYCSTISGTDLYFGGDFYRLGNIVAGGIIKYDTINKKWSGLNGGIIISGAGGPGGSVRSIVLSGTDIYAGGFLFVSSSGSVISKWNTITETWAAVSPGTFPPLGGVSNGILSLAVSGADIYAGGNFQVFQGEPYNYIIKYNPSVDVWQPLASTLNNIINTIVVSGSFIYAGGLFTSTGSYTARYNTQTNFWSSMSGGLNGTVRKMIVSGTDIYAAGSFTTTGSRIARWDTLTQNWDSGSATTLNSEIWDISLSGNNIYAAGAFIVSGNRFGKLDTTTKNWTFPSGTTSNSTIFSILPYNNDIYLGGTFTTMKPYQGLSSNSDNDAYFVVTSESETSFFSLPATKITLYSSSNSSYKQFEQNSIYNEYGGFNNVKLISASNGLNKFSFGYYNNSSTNRYLCNSKTTDGITWSSNTFDVPPIHSGDYFGEYYDYIFENKGNVEKVLFIIGSTMATTGSKRAAGVVSMVSATLLLLPDGKTKYWNYSNKIILGTGSNPLNKFGTGISAISCSSGYQVFIGELYGDYNGVNSGSIWVTTSSNGGSLWSNPIRIANGSVASSSVGFNNIKAVNFSKSGESRSYVFFTEPLASDTTGRIGKFYVLSSSINNNWGEFDNNFEKTLIYSSSTESGRSTDFDISGSSKNSIEVHSNNETITYCFINGLEYNKIENNSEILIGNTNDGKNWKTFENLLNIKYPVKNIDILALSTYEKNGKEYPIFFTNLSSSIGTGSVNNIIYLTNNKYTEFSLNNSGTDKYVKQAALEPVMAPGILYNSIKSGIAVDWPCATGSQTSIEPYGSGTIVNSYYPQSFKMASYQGNNINELNIYGSLRSNIDYRIDFEKLIFPDDIFPVKNQLTASLLETTNLSSLSEDSDLVQFISGCYIYGGYEPYTSPVDFSDFNQLGPKRFSVPFVYRKENSKGNGLYSMAMSNFLAETVRFFLKDGLLTSFQSKPDSQWGVFEKNRKYYMDIVMSKTPNLVMMEAYHSSKHPTGSRGEKMNGRYFGYPVNKTNKKLWSADSEELFTQEEAKLIHNDPACAPYTPPYFEGEAIARVSFSPTITRKYSIDEIFANLEVEDIFPGVARGAHINSDAYLNKMPVEASIDVKGKLPWIDITRGSQNTTTTNNDVNTWIISTKFETPVLDFSSQSLTPYENNYMKSSGYGRGMWSGYGEIPTQNKGIYVSLRESFPQKINRKTSTVQSLLQKVGFTQTSKKVGLLADQKIIKEAVMVIPFIEQKNRNNLRTFSYSRDGSKLTDIEKELQIQFIGVRKDIYQQIIQNNTNSSILNTINKMKEFIVPPQFDYVKDTSLDPFVAYIIPFEHKLSKQDLADIWQGVAPKIATVAQLDEQTISHENKLTEFFHGEGMPNNIRFMVFKIKQKGEFDYFKVTRDSTDDNTFEREIGRKIDDYSYNWPYDFYSLVELAKVDVQVEYKNKNTTQQTTTSNVTTTNNITSNSTIGTTVKPKI